MISDLTKDLGFIERIHSEALAASIDAGPLGNPGARIHDLLHATAARKFHADLLLTLDIPGFHDLADTEIRGP